MIGSSTLRATAPSVFPKEPKKDQLNSRRDDEDDEDEDDEDEDDEDEDDEDKDDEDEDDEDEDDRSSSGRRKSCGARVHTPRKSVPTCAEVTEEKQARKARSAFAVLPPKKNVVRASPPFSSERIDADSSDLKANLPPHVQVLALLERDRRVHTSKYVYYRQALLAITQVLHRFGLGQEGPVRIGFLAAAGGDGARVLLQQWDSEPRLGTQQIEIMASDVIPDQDKSSPVNVVGLSDRLLSPFSDADIIILQNCFYSPTVCFRQVEDMLRCLKPGGICVIGVHFTQQRKFAPALRWALSSGFANMVGFEWHGTDCQQTDHVNVNQLFTLCRTDVPITHDGLGIVLCRTIIGLLGPATTSAPSSSSSSSSSSSYSSAAAGEGLSTVQRLKLVLESQMSLIVEHEGLCVAVRGKAVAAAKDITTLLGYIANAENMLIDLISKPLLGEEYHNDIVRIATEENTSLFLTFLSKIITAHALAVAEAALRNRLTALKTAKTPKARLTVLDADIGVKRLIDGCDLKALPTTPKAGCYIMECLSKAGVSSSKVGVGGNDEALLNKRIKVQKPSAVIVAIALPEDLAWRRGETEGKRLFRRALLDGCEAFLTLFLGGGQSMQGMKMSGDPRSDRSAGGTFFLPSLSLSLPPLSFPMLTRPFLPPPPPHSPPSPFRVFLLSRPDRRAERQY
jgi:hypothetical protein